MMDLWSECLAWQNTKEYNRSLWERFVQYVNDNPSLNRHRSFCERHVYGFGERAFHWLWKLVVDAMPPDLNFLEIGVYKGQVLSLIRLLAPQAMIHGITMLSSFSGPSGKFPPFPETDYIEHIRALHEEFGQYMPGLIVGDSTDPQAIHLADVFAPYDLVYIDGCHEYDYVRQDIENYGPMVRPGGLLLVDDSSNYLNMWPGSFPGIVEVSKAVRDTLEQDSAWQHLIAVMHLRAWQRIKEET